jgi:hypothetical protein
VEVAAAAEEVEAVVLLLVLVLLAAAWAAHVTWALARALRERKPRRKGGASDARLANECV